MDILIRVLLFGIFASSCGTISIVSSPPGAEIEVIKPGKEISEPLGKTPFEKDLGSLTELINEGTVILIVKKRGYEPQRFVIPNIPSGDLRIESFLLPNLPSNYKEVNTIIGKVLAAERFIIENQLEEAERVANEILEVNSNVASAHEIKGTVFFLQKNFSKSRMAWIRALELDPNNPEAESMLTKIEEIITKNGAGVH